MQKDRLPSTPDLCDLVGPELFYHNSKGGPNLHSIVAEEKVKKMFAVPHRLLPGRRGRDRN
jgi:hypothetical protein